MKEDTNLIKIYVGPEGSALLLKSRLEETGINTLIKNDYSGAWTGTAPDVVDLYIEETDLADAEPVIRDFLGENQ